MGVASQPGRPADPARRLRPDERRRLVLLGLPTFAFAFGLTVTTTYLPTVLERLTASTTSIGLIVGAQGLLAVLLPAVVGPWSDRLDGPLGGRLPFLVAGLPLAAVGLAAMALVGSLAAAAIAVGVFFAGYFVAYEPYRALYPDLLRQEVAGRGQSTQAVWRSVGSGLALLTGGLLLAVDQALPFLLAAALVVLCGASFVGLVVRRGVPHRPATGASVRAIQREMLALLRRPGPLRAFFVANALWELALAALLAFVILWMTQGLGLTLSGSALAVGAATILVVLGGAVSGVLADSVGARRVTLAAAVVSAAGLLFPILSTDTTVIVLGVPFVTVGMGVLLALPYALLIPLMPPDRHGAMTAFYSASRGLGIMLGPVVAGAAIALLDGPFASTDGYAAMWLVCAVALAASVPFALRVR